jgi:NAD(P)-dependent dehydrogenase (short-subunit alcohol dehydrogenase family)
MLERTSCLVTGASRGIGQAIALELGRLGATVIGTATSPEGAAKSPRCLAMRVSKGEGASSKCAMLDAGRCADRPYREDLWRGIGAGQQRRHYARQPRACV